MVEILREAPERTDEALLRELEALWEAPAAAEPRPSPRSWAYGPLVRTLVGGWPAVLLAIVLVAPAAAPGEVYPAWVVGASFAIFFGPVLAGIVGGNGRPGIGLALSASLAGLGVAVGIACRATAHHSGSWWAVETGLFAALAAVSVLALAVRPRS